MKFAILLLLIINSVTYYSCSPYYKLTHSNYDYYKIALNYISTDTSAINFISESSLIQKRNKNINLVVSPKVIPPQLVEFGSYSINNDIDFYLDRKYFDYRNSIVDSLTSFENKLKFLPYFNHELEELYPNNNGNAIIFFSKAYSNFLTANLFYKKKDTSISEMPSFGPSLNYLFTFKDGKIDLIMKQIITNN